MVGVQGYTETRLMDGLVVSVLGSPSIGKYPRG